MPQINRKESFSGIKISLGSHRVGKLMENRKVLFPKELPLREQCKKFPLNGIIAKRKYGINP